MVPVAAPAPTSARGPAARRRRRRTPAGFTLLELLLVIVLLAILTSVVTITSRPDPRQALLQDAKRIGLLMGVAGDESRMRRVPVDWEADLHGYRFTMGSAQDVSTFPNDDLLHERSWATPLTLLAVVDLSSGITRTLVNADAPPLRVGAAHEWVQSPWRLELHNEQAAVAVEFDANGHANVVQ